MPTSDLRQIIAQNIRATAQRRGVSLNALADLAGVSRSQLYNVLGGASGVTLEWLECVADALDVDTADLLRKPRRSKRRQSA